uniref:hypothetical protein n=1 Tax=Cupriavidus yeoncheonensis TaxID=1462994 RepID=UPI003F4959E6
MLGLLAMWASGEMPWDLFKMLSAIVLGPLALAQPHRFDANIALSGLVVHLLFSICLGAILALIIAPFSFDSSLGVNSLVGALFGITLYFVNLYGMTNAFPWFAEVRGAVPFALHVVFGLVVADTYFELEPKDASLSRLGVA